jgi:hypothetical protein
MTDWVRERGFTLEVAESTSGLDGLRIVVSHELTPSLEVAENAAAEIEAEAIRHGGSYDGWERDVVHVARRT